MGAVDPSVGAPRSVGPARESRLDMISCVAYREEECRAVKVWKPFRAVKGRQRREAIFLRARLSRSCNLRRYLPSSLRQITTRYHVASLHLQRLSRQFATASSDSCASTRDIQCSLLLASQSLLQHSTCIGRALGTPNELTSTRD